MYVTLIAVLLPNAVFSQEYFGKFDPPNPGVTVETPVDPQNDRISYRLTDSLVFTDPNGFDWTAPAGTISDGASIPRWAWSVIGAPFSGRYAISALLHDHYCETRERTSHDTHRSFYYGMRANGVKTVKAKFMYWAVVFGGPDWKILTARKTINLEEYGEFERAIALDIAEQTLRKIEKEPSITLKELNSLADIQGRGFSWNGQLFLEEFEEGPQMVDGDVVESNDRTDSRRVPVVPPPPVTLP